MSLTPLARGIWLLAVAAAAVLLMLLAHWQLGRQWQRETLAELAALGRGDTPLRWELDRPASLVGERVFGDCVFRQDDAGLLLSRGSDGCEIGLVLRGALDLSRYGRLVVEADGPAPAVLVLRPRLDQAQQAADLPGGLQAGGGPIDLQALHWRSETGQALAPPQRAAMLRLRLGRLDQDLRLRRASLWPAAWPWPRSMPPPAAWQPLQAAMPATTPPLFLAEGQARPEQLLHQRDLLRAREPAALLILREDLPRLIATGAAAAQGAESRAYRWPRWLLLGSAALMLAWLHLNPPANLRLRAALQAAGVLALPLYLIMDLRIGDDLDNWTLAALGLALLFAAGLARDRLAPAWQWRGSLRTWLLAGLAPGLALLLVATLGQPDPRRFSATALGGYALWALLQQFLICRLFADRLHQAGAAPRWTILGAALAFALLHTPNAALMLATFAGGLLWTWIWLRERSLLPLAVSHALAASLLLGGLPRELLRSAEVSLRYYL